MSSPAQHAPPEVRVIFEPKDGSTPITIRSIRPDDREELRDGFRKLSPISRYQRFFSEIQELTEQQLDYLTQVTCTDGSHPFADRGDAHAARAGNVGPGGRCDRIIDQYVVPCPEATYQVFVDAYRCPEAP